MHELEDEVKQLRSELSPQYSQLLLQYASYDKPQQDRWGGGSSRGRQCSGGARHMGRGRKGEADKPVCVCVCLCVRVRTSMCTRLHPISPPPLPQNHSFVAWYPCRKFFECLYEALIAVVDDAFGRLGKKPDIEREVSQRS